jgi:hypothetical protein
LLALTYLNLSITICRARLEAELETGASRLGGAILKHSIETDKKKVLYIVNGTREDDLPRVLVALGREMAATILSALSHSDEVSVELQKCSKLVRLFKHCADQICTAAAAQNLKEAQRWMAVTRSPSPPSSSSFAPDKPGPASCRTTGSSHEGASEGQALPSPTGLTTRQFDTRQSPMCAQRDLSTASKATADDAGADAPRGVCAPESASVTSSEGYVCEDVFSYAPNDIPTISTVVDGKVMEKGTNPGKADGLECQGWSTGDYLIPLSLSDDEWVDFQAEPSLLDLET